MGPSFQCRSASSFPPRVKGNTEAAADPVLARQVWNNNYENHRFRLHCPLGSCLLDTFLLGTGRRT